MSNSCNEANIKEQSQCMAPRCKWHDKCEISPSMAPVHWLFANDNQEDENGNRNAQVENDSVDHRRAPDVVNDEELHDK